MNQIYFTGFFPNVFFSVFLSACGFLSFSGPSLASHGFLLFFGFSAHSCSYSFSPSALCPASQSCQSHWPPGAQVRGCSCTITPSLLRSRLCFPPITVTGDAQGWGGLGLTSDQPPPLTPSPGATAIEPLDDIAAVTDILAQREGARLETPPPWLAMFTEQPALPTPCSAASVAPAPAWTQPLAWGRPRTFSLDAVPPDHCPVASHSVAPLPPRSPRPRGLCSKGLPRTWLQSPV